MSIPLQKKIPYFRVAPEKEPKLLATAIRENVCALVEAYIEATGISESAASKKFYGSSSFFQTFRTGEHSISVKRLDIMLQEFREAWPPDAEWPHLRPILIPPPTMRKSR